MWQTNTYLCHDCRENHISHVYVLNVSSIPCQWGSSLAREWWVIWSVSQDLSGHEWSWEHCPEAGVTRQRCDGVTLHITDQQLIVTCHSHHSPIWIVSVGRTDLGSWLANQRSALGPVTNQGSGCPIRRSPLVKVTLTWPHRMHFIFDNGTTNSLAGIARLEISWSYKCFIL